MKFKSEKDTLFSLIILGVNTFLVAIIVFEMIHEKMDLYEYLIIILTFGIVGLLFWIYYGTNYKLSKHNELIYKSGPFKGKIKIDQITEIIKNKTLWIGIKPATSRKGLIIKYDKYNEIYISPKTNELFIEEILKLNREINITL